MTDTPLLDLPAFDGKPRVDDALLELVLDTYTPEGVVTWCHNWLAADNHKRRQMRAGLLSA